MPLQKEPTILGIVKSVAAQSKDYARATVGDAVTWSKEHATKVVAGSTLIALGTLGIAGCGGPDTAKADHTPTPPAATAPVTPGATETPSATATTTVETTTSPETADNVGELVKKSNVFNALSVEQQAQVMQDISPSTTFAEFELKPASARALDAEVLTDAVKGPYLEKVGNLILPGMPTPLNKSKNIATGLDDLNLATSMYDKSLTATPNKLTPVDNAWPYFQNMLALSIAGNLAAKGDPNSYLAAQKMVGGSLEFTGTDAEDANHGNITTELQKLEQYYSSKNFNAPFMGFPQSTTDAHIILPGGHEVSIEFAQINPSTYEITAGPNELGNLATTFYYHEGPIVNGKQTGFWTQGGSDTQANGSVIVALQPNS